MSLEETEFTINKESLRQYEKLRKQLIGSDLILLLLSVAPIKGNTRMQKQVFLTWKEIFNDVTLDPTYYPWKYGAYSKVIEDAARILERQGYIEVKKRKGEGSLYSITSAGKKKIESRMLELKLNWRNLKEKKIDWDEWTPRGTIRYVYRNYPEYTSKSEVPSLKWE